MAEHELRRPAAGSLNKRSILAAVLGVTEFSQIIVLNVFCYLEAYLHAWLSVLFQSKPNQITQHCQFENENFQF